MEEKIDELECDARNASVIESADMSMRAAQALISLEGSQAEVEYQKKHVQFLEKEISSLQENIENLREQLQNANREIEEINSKPVLTGDYFNVFVRNSILYAFFHGGCTAAAFIHAESPHEDAPCGLPQKRAEQRCILIHSQITPTCHY